jgi:hypothetical protein
MLTRRQLLGLIGGTALGAIGIGPAARAAQACAAGSSKCRPAISGTGWGESGWREELEQQHHIGFDLLWLCNVPASLDAPGDPVKQILDLCAKRKVRVILDTGSSGKWFDPFEPAAEIERCDAGIKRIGERYAGHPAFRYWYIPHEIYMAWDDFARKIDMLYPGLVERCKKAANLPVGVSPFFVLDAEKMFGGGFRYNQPGEYERYWARQIKHSGFDVVMLQDSGEHFSFCTNDRRRPFFAAMRNACKASGARFWGNVECAEVECPSPEEYIKRYGRVHMSTVSGLPWRPVPIDRLKGKLELAAEYADDIVTWGYREFCRPDTSAAAKKWYDDYLAYRKAIKCA